MRWLDRLYAKHPRLTMAAMILIAFVALYITNECDRSNTDALRWQMAAHTN